MGITRSLLNLSTRRIRCIYVIKRNLTSFRDDYIDFNRSGLTRIEKSHFKGPKTKIPKYDNITDFIFMNKANVKDRSALVASRNGQKYSYRQTYTHVCNLAAFIEKEYISKYKPESESDKFVISVALSNSIKTAVVYLGVPKINNAILNPVNPLLTECNEFSNVFSVVNPNLIICEPGNVDYIKNSIMNYKLHPPQNIICLDSDLWHEFTRNNCEKTPDLENIKINAKVNHSPAIYGMSSGTTGLPKGVVLSHNNIIANIHQAKIASDMAITIKDNSVLHALPLYHIYGFSTMLYHEMMDESTIVIQPNFDPRSFLENIERYKIKRMYVAPAVVNFMATHNMLFNYNIQSIRDLICAAAPLSPTIIDAFIKRFSYIFLRQGYGLTETSPIISMNRERNKKMVSVGQPIHNTEHKILNPDNHELKDIGEAGELVTRGPQIMKGYLNKIDETSKVLKEDGCCTGLTKIEKSHFKGPITKFPKCDSITDFIFMNKANVKNRTALTTSQNGENYSYQQTYTHVCNLAAFIEKEYISKYKPENKSDKFVISVALSNSIKTAVVYLGVPKINNAILNPVNPLLTECNEFSNVFSVVNPNLIICEPGNIDYIKNSIMNYKLPQPENIICLDSDLWYEFTRNNCETVPDLNYVKINEKINDSPAIYGMSSGTTGLSKGVVLSHNNIISNIHQIRITSEMAIDNKELTLLHSLPLHHAYGFGVMLYNEIMSASNIVIQPNFEPRTFLKDIERYKDFYDIFLSQNLRQPYSLDKKKFPKNPF
ncbi:hypothetical protein A3Q56_00563 [Intoshia linei]|uniref:AMP-dependent synthetase/ligase domain-containing protein n=1 Tax=Intoshia linei TaxID=1819745 RepID=A0A177BBQ3_9BILA|nr:hypothetical protein A3Q56_00563 [Intoshia linei]